MVWAPKKSSCDTFSIFHAKIKSKLVCEYLNSKNLFKRQKYPSQKSDTNILPQNHWTSNIYRPSAGWFWVSLNYPILNIKKMVCLKNVWCSTENCFGRLLLSFIFAIIHSKWCRKVFLVLKICFSPNTRFQLSLRTLQIARWILVIATVKLQIMKTRKFNSFTLYFSTL